MSESTDNLYRIDDVLVRTGYVLGALVLLMSFGVLDDSPVRTWPLPAVISYGMFALAPAVLLIAGYKVRRRETRTVELGRVMRVHPEMPISELRAMTGFSRSQLRDAVNLLNRKAQAGLMLDDGSNTVRHVSSTRGDTLTHSQRCASCGASVSVTVAADTRVEELSCTYCNGALDSASISRLQYQLQTPSPGPAPQPFFSAQPAPVQQKRFSLFLFILLLMFFWPAAVGYAVIRHKSLPIKFDG
ncbi:MAG: hypothetical protein AB8G17_01995 [Gammaproteobacteria bacterium]